MLLGACIFGASLLDATQDAGHRRPAVDRAQAYLPDLPVDHPAIEYFSRPVDDPVARLDARLRRGDLTLERGPDGLGYLPALLEHLGAHPDSQALVFSKTSFQAERIAPANPRAIYFGDDVAVAFVRGSADLEVIALDPRQGPIFYTTNIETLPQEGFTRREVCLTCHQGPATSGVPGMFVGSVFPDPTGAPSPIGAIITDHRTDFEDRWGGWYVNATRGQQEDRANAVASNPAQPLLLDERLQNLTHLYGKIDPAGYLTPVSDIVALMTFEHQTQMMNYITRVGWEARIVEHDGESEATLAQLDADIEAMVVYMLFADEVPLPEPVEGVSAFARTFPARGPRDGAGRSLRDFDLESRLFRYPLSYMVYSRAFDALPQRVLDRVYRRLYEVLAGNDASGPLAGLSDDDRRAVLQILRDTKEGLPAYWRPEE